MSFQDCTYWKDDKCTLDPRGVICECAHPELNKLLMELHACGVADPRSPQAGRQISEQREKVFKKMDDYLSSVEGDKVQADYVRARINHFRSVTQLPKEENQ